MNWIRQLFWGQTNVVKTEGGIQWWLKNGEPHREDDLPAEIWPDGTQWWWKEGWPHRDGDKPACIEADGTQRWYINGKKHREGFKPTAVYLNGYKEWYRNGVHLSQNEILIMQHRLAIEESNMRRSCILYAVRCNAVNDACNVICQYRI